MSPYSHVVCSVQAVDWVSLPAGLSSSLGIFPLPRTEGTDYSLSKRCCFYILRVNSSSLCSNQASNLSVFWCILPLWLVLRVTVFPRDCWYPEGRGGALFFTLIPIRPCKEDMPFIWQDNTIVFHIAVWGGERTAYRCSIRTTYASGLVSERAELFDPDRI